MRVPTFFSVLLPALSIVLLAVTSPYGAAQCEPHEHLPPSAGAVDFGNAVSIDGDYMAVGDPQASVGGVSKAGRVHVYRRNAAGPWAHQVTLVQSNPKFDDLFGTSVAIFGDRLAVGATGLDGEHENSGGVVVYRRFGTLWIAETVLQQTGASQQGRAVSLHGSELAVGASSRALIYSRLPNGWQFAQLILPASPGVPTSAFGSALAINEHSLIVGDPAWVYDFGDPVGRVSAYRREPTLWTLTSQLAPSLVYDGYFGFSVAIAGDYLVVGAFRDQGKPVGGNAAGSAYAYKVTAGAWQFQQKIYAADGAGLDQFGISVAITPSTIAIGAPGRDGPFVNSGKVYLFERQGEVWTNRQTIVGNPTGSDRFGSAVGISQDSLVAGAPDRLVGQSAAGAVWTQRVRDGQALFACPDELSVSSGGEQLLLLSATSEQAGQVYFVLGSATGTSPGIPIDGWLLPLVWDGYLDLMLQVPNSGVHQSTFGFLTGSGTAAATLNLPPSLPPSLAGVTLHHAYLAIDVFAWNGAVTFTSNATSVLLKP